MSCTRNLHSKPQIAEIILINKINTLPKGRVFFISKNSVKSIANKIIKVYNVNQKGSAVMPDTSNIIIAVYCIIIFTVFFSIQYFCCVKIKTKAIRYIPMGITVAFEVLCALIYLGFFGEWSGSFLGGVNRLFAAIMAVPVTIALIAEILAVFAFKVFRIKED